MNRTLVGEESPPQTLADLLRAAAEHTASDQPGLIMSSDFYPTAGIFFALGGQLADAAGTSLLREGSALPAYLRTLQDLSESAQSGHVALNAPSDAFREGRVPFLLGGSWQLAELRLAPGDGLFAAPLPAVDGQPWSPLIRTWNLYMGLDSLQLGAAMDFARYVTSDDAQALTAREAAIIPANPDAWDADPDIRTIAQSLVEAGVPIPNRPEMAAYWEPLQLMIRAAAGGQDAEAAALAGQDAVDAAVDAWRERR
jgi:maltose-binding protein MalE